MIRKILLYGLLSVGAFVAVFPFLWMLTTAFKTYPESISPTLQLFPAHWQWRNAVEVFEEVPFHVYFYNTFVVAVAVTLCVVATSLAAGYAFARLEFAGRGFLFGAVLATMMVPFEIKLIPNFVLINAFGWYDSYAALIVPWCANGFSIFLMRQAFLGLPRDYYEAARVDGCGHARFLVFVAAPLVKPMAVTVALFAFLGSYNSLLWPLVVTSTDAMRVVQVGLTMFSGDTGVKVNLLMCASAFVILPTVGLYFAAQRYFLESSLGAGIKG